MNNLPRAISLVSFFVVFSMTTLAGCAEVATINPGERYIVDEQLRSPSSNSSVGRFNARIIFLADQIERNIDRKSTDNTFIVTSFTNLNRLSETTAFGRLVAEDLIHELQVRRWKVFEVRLTRDVTINETGEFSLSRDISKIKEAYKVGGIVTGTYSVADNNVVVNARVIDMETGLVASSGQVHMPVGWFTEGLLFNSDHLKPMKIVGDGPSGTAR
ncbi:FlgO family outer membrane protein [Geotalea sp. SG265]|uniref:FlgO family outer membrane protein n=1 Tax=Geotalea sp. SG265 TaxID=2922867 RepID=UPI001FB00FAA|nr:FlgO family outer membrane protein [Geotalea sp. SG265]